MTTRPRRPARPSALTFSGATGVRADTPPAAPPAPPAPPTPPPASTPSSTDAQPSETPRSPDVKTSDQKPLAYTWRITPDQADTMDDLVRHVRRQLGIRRLDRATVLDGLVAIATSSDEIRAALIRHLKDRHQDV